MYAKQMHHGHFVSSSFYETSVKQQAKDYFEGDVGNLVLEEVLSFLTFWVALHILKSNNISDEKSPPIL